MSGLTTRFLIVSAVVMGLLVAGATAATGAEPAVDGRAQMQLASPSFIDHLPNDARVEDPVGGCATISGQVSMAGVEGFDISPSRVVEVYGDADAYLGYVYVASDGQWGVTGLPAGSYKLKVVTWGSDDDYLDEFWNNSYDVTTAQAVNVVLGQWVRGIDVQLDRPGDVGVVSGQVRGPDGQRFSSRRTGNSYVEAIWIFDSEDRQVAFTRFSGNGDFVFPALPNGSYTAEVRASGYAVKRQLFTIASAPVQLNPALDLESTLSGRISTPIRGVTGKVEAVDESGQVVRSASFNSANADFADYKVEMLPAGKYTLKFIVDNVNVRTQWWRNAPTRESANVIQVGENQHSLNVDVALESGPVPGISGNVTGTELYYVTLYDQDGVSVASVESDDNGDYRFSNLASGTYKVGVAGQSPPNFEFPEFWNNGRSLADATPIAVTTSLVSGIDVAMDRGGIIAGDLITANADLANPINREVAVYDSPGHYVGGSIDYWRPNAKYWVTNLNTGRYKVRVIITDYESGQHFEVWNGGATQFDDAPWVEVKQGERTALDLSIDFAQGTTGSISGIITGPSSAALASTVRGRVVAFDAKDVGVEGWFGDDGRYVIPALEPGIYKVRFVSNDHRYRSQWLGGVSNAYESQGVTVRRQANTGNVDANLALTGSATAPGKPTSVVFNGQRASWAVPENNGGSPVVEYVVQRSNDAGQTWSRYGVTAATAIAISAADEGQLLRVAARNAAGTGSYARASYQPVTTQPPREQPITPPAQENTPKPVPVKPVRSKKVPSRVSLSTKTVLPKKNARGERLKWRSTTTSTCVIKRGRLVAKKRGTCQLTATSVRKNGREIHRVKRYKVKVVRKTD